MLGTRAFGGAAYGTVAQPRGIVATRVVGAPVRPQQGFISNGSKVTCMRHRVKKRRLGRPADQRKALLRSLVTSVLEHGAIETTRVKAKAVSKYVDRIVTLAKRGDKHAFNQAVAYVYKRSVVQKAFDLLPTFYRHRHGGYTRVIPPHERGGRVRRRGDSAEMAYLELTPGMVDEDELEELLDESDEDVELEDGELPLDLRKPYLQFCIDMVKGNMPDQNAWDIASRDFRPDLLYRWLRDPRMTDEQRDTFLKKLDTAINTNNPRIPKELQKYRRIRKVDSDSDEEEEDLDPPQYAVNVQSLSATLNQFVLTKQARQAARADEEFDHEDKTEAVADEDFEAEVPEWRDEVDADVDVGSLEAYEKIGDEIDADWDETKRLKKQAEARLKSR